MRDYMQSLLASKYTVEAFVDGASALERAFAEPPDLIVSDVMMPGVDGFELLGAIRTEPRTRAVPVIIVSANVGDDTRIDCLSAGADFYLSKPFTGRDLLACVADQLHLARQRRKNEPTLQS